MKFLSLPLFILNVCWIDAQETPPPSPAVTDSLDRYSTDSVGFSKSGSGSKFSRSISSLEEIPEKNLDANAPLKGSPQNKIF